MNEYVLRGGLEGKKRLEILARALWPTTARALTDAGLRPGMTCLDLGCGGGDVAREMARLAGPAGRVVALDADRVVLELARAAAREQGLANLEFRESDVRTWRETDAYDLIYGRFILSHLDAPATLLAHMLRGVRPGGIALVEDIDFRGGFCHPECPAYDTYNRLYREVVRRRRGDPEIGPRLASLLADAGWQSVSVRLAQPVFTSGEGKSIELLSLINIGEALLAEQLIDRTELDAIIDELDRFVRDPRTLIGLPRIFQVWGTRPGAG